MKGSIVKRGDSYSIIIDIGRDAFGKRKQRWFSGFKSRKDAENQLPRILIKLEDGELIDNNSVTLGNFLDDWLKSKIKKDNLSPTTVDGYKNIIFKHLIPTIGKLKLQDIKPYNLQKYFDVKNEILSARTLANHKRVLSSALIYALDMDLIEKNPLPKVKLPRQQKEETRILNIDECNLLLEKVKSNLTLKIPVMLALLLGLRRGEVLGLSWDAVDLDNKTISVVQNLEYVDGKYYFKDPKTLKSKRTISIPKSLVALLREHYKWQCEVKVRSKNTWGTDQNLVCTRKKNGLPMTPHVLSDMFNKYLKRNNLPHVRFHDLRHTNASLMLASGVSSKVAGNRLGHSKVSITLDLYSHVMESVDIEAAEKIDMIIKNNNKITKILKK
jgi:integrase